MASSGQDNSVRLMTKAEQRRSRGGQFAKLYARNTAPEFFLMRGYVIKPVDRLGSNWCDHLRQNGLLRVQMIIGRHSCGDAKRRVQ